jgi:ABC-2 type transport system permease protein
MSDREHLFQHRRKKAWAKGARYALAIARSLHLFPALFAIFVLAMYRKLLEEWLPPDFPVVWLLVALLTPVLATARFRSFIQPADSIFLAPASHALNRYWQQAFTYNAIIQCLFVLGWMAFLSPLYIQRVGAGIDWVMAVIVLLTFKVFHLWLRLHELFSLPPRWTDPVIRWGTSALVTFWLFSGSFFGIPLAVALVWSGLLIIHHRKRRPPRGYIPWERLISEETATVTRYYRLASQFIDIPHIGNEIKIRRGWQWLNRFPARRPEHTYLYLFQRTFLRYREPFGVTIRLTLITGLAVAWAGFLPSFAALLYLLGLWMTAVQLPWVRRMHRFQPWFRLYPLPEHLKTEGLSRLAWVILLAVSALMLILPALTWQHPLPALPLMLAGGWIFSTLYARWHLPRKMGRRKMVSRM